MIKGNEETSLDVSSFPFIIPYGGFSRVRLEGWQVRLDRSFSSLDCDGSELPTKGVLRPYGKRPWGRTVHGHTAVAGVAQDDRAQVGTTFAPGRASAGVAGVRRSPPSAWPATSGASSGGGSGPASPRLRTAMREAEKVEGSRFPLTTISPISFRIATEPQ